MKKPSGAPRPDFIDNDALREIRANTDWHRTFTALGLVQAPGKGSPDDWWALSPFAPDEKTPSFHMNADPGGGGRWYCHSTGQGGGMLDLVQAIHGGNIYQAGQWLLDQQCSHMHRAPLSSTPHCTSPAKPDIPENPGASGEKEREPQCPENTPIRQSLLPMLTEPGTHPEFERRGLSRATCQYLGCGYLPKTSNSSLKDRIVFQIRGVDDLEALSPKSTILTHMGRALTDEQAARDGKWAYYKGFRKSLELYNLDQLRLDPEATAQIRQAGHILLVEGCFDVAKCVEAGVKNVIASFGTAISQAQMDKLHLLREVMGAREIKVWFDRDQPGQSAQHSLVNSLSDDGLPARGFDWQQTFSSSERHSVSFPDTLTDPGEFSVQQLRWLRQNKTI